MPFKINNIPDWTQAQLNTVVNGGAPPPLPANTVLNDIVLPSDWNALPTYFVPYTGATGDVDLGAYSLTTTNLTSTGLINLATTSSSTVGLIQQNSSRFLHTYGTQNVFLGKNAGNFTTSGTGGNVAIGEEALIGLTTGFKNIGIGYQAGKSLTTPQGCVAIGYSAMATSTDNLNNLAIGVQSMQFLAAGGGASNVAVGTNAMRNPTAAISSVAIGGTSAQGTTSSSYNYSVAIGDGSMGAASLVNVNKSVAIGQGALGSVTSSDHNVAIGRRAGQNITSASGDIIIGSEVGAQSATSGGRLNIGNLLYGTGLATAPSSVTSTPVNGSFGVNVEAPASNFHINNTSGAPTFRMTAFTDSLKSLIFGLSNEDMTIEAPSAYGNGTMAFKVNLTEKARFNPAGLFGINTGATVSARLHVIATSALCRLGYNTTNYMNVDLSSAAVATFALTASSGTPYFVFANDINLGTKNLVTDTTTGTKIGTATGQKLGLWNVTPIIQPASADQAAVTTTVATTAATNIAPYGYTTQAQADDLITEVGQLKVLVNQLRSDLVAFGAIKGSA